MPGPLLPLHAVASPSSIYSNTHSDALRPPSRFFQSFSIRTSTPRTPRTPRQPPSLATHTPWPSATAAINGDQIYEAPPGRRSRASVHSVIDAIPSPVVGTPRLGTHPMYLHPNGGVERSTPLRAPSPALLPGPSSDMPISFNASEIGPAAPRAPPRRHKGSRRRRNPAPKLSGKQRTVWRDPAVRVKLMHTLVSGALLATTLILCTYPLPARHDPSPPLIDVSDLPLTRARTQSCPSRRSQPSARPSGS